jgi:hypothetical protein
MLAKLSNWRTVSEGESSGATSRVAVAGVSSITSGSGAAWASVKRYRYVNLIGATADDVRTARS